METTSSKTFNWMGSEECSQKIGKFSELSEEWIGRTKARSRSASFKSILAGISVPSGFKIKTSV